MRSFSASCGLLAVPESHSRLPVTGSVPAETRTSQALPRWTTLPRSRLFPTTSTLVVGEHSGEQPPTPASHTAGSRRWEVEPPRGIEPRTCSLRVKSSTHHGAPSLPIYPALHRYVTPRLPSFAHLSPRLLRPHCDHRQPREAVEPGDVGLAPAMAENRRPSNFSSRATPSTSPPRA